MVGVIDGTHVPLSFRPQRSLTPMLSDFLNRKKFHSVLLQAVSDSERFFWNVYVGQRGGVHDAAQFTWSKIYT